MNLTEGILQTHTGDLTLDLSLLIKIDPLKLPFQFLLGLASQISSECLDACLSHLEEWMVPDQQIHCVDRWLQYEAEGHPTWWRAMSLLNLIDKFAEGLQNRPVVCLIRSLRLDLDDYASLLLFKRYWQHGSIHIKVCADSTCEELDTQLQQLQLEIKHVDDNTTHEPCAQLAAVYTRLTGLDCMGWTELMQGAASADILRQAEAALYRYLQLGVGDAAIRLLQHIVEHNKMDVQLKGRLEITLMLFQFFTHQYVLIAESKEPLSWRMLPKEFRLKLYYIKAYSATLARNLTIAGKYYKRMGMTPERKAETEDVLFQLNNFALYQFLSSHAEVAMQIERTIEETVTTLKIQSCGLRYVNAINISRLLRISKRYDESCHYYGKAYQVINHRMSESDWVYRAHNYFIVHSSAGDEERALFFLLQSSMAWMSMAAPEALSWRPLCAVMKDYAVDTLKPVNYIEIAKYFKTSLWKVMAKCYSEQELLPDNTDLVFQSLPCRERIVELVRQDTDFAWRECFEQIESLARQRHMQLDHNWLSLHTIAQELMGFRCK